MEHKTRKYSKGVFLNIFDANQDSWEKGMRFVRSLAGVEHVEILLEYVPEKPEELQKLRKLTEGYRRIIHAPFTSVSLVTSRQEIAEASFRVLDKALDAADALDAPIATVHAGDYSLWTGREYALEAAARYFRSLSAKKDRRVRPALENLPKGSVILSNFPRYVAEMAEVKKTFSGIAYTLDVGHCFQNDDNLWPFLASESEAILDIHLHDAITKGAAHLALGKGELDLEKFLSALKDVAYCGFVSLETIGETDTAASWETLHKAEEKVFASV